jgi:hypothetical protein
VIAAADALFAPLFPEDFTGFVFKPDRERRVNPCVKIACSRRRVPKT